MPYCPRTPKPGSWGQPQSQDQGPSAFVPGFVQGWCGVLGIPPAAPDLCTTSALKPLLQEPNIPAAPLCPSPPRHPSHTEAMGGHQPSPPTSLVPLQTGWPPAQHSSGWLQASLEGQGWK